MRERWVLSKIREKDKERQRMRERKVVMRERKVVMREKVGFIENTARRHRGSGCREATVASRLTDR